MLLLVFGLSIRLTALGEDATNATARDPGRLLDDGISIQKQALAAKTPAEIAGNYRKAIEQFRRAAELAPDSYRAHYLWGHAAYGLVLQTTDRVQRQQLLIKAREQYQTAAGCPGAEWAASDELGAMLTNEISLLGAGAAERRAVLQEAINSLKAGYSLARFSGERATVERDLGVAFLSLAQSSQGLPSERALYKQAVEKFESATKVESEAKTPRIYGLWGVALLELGKADNDRTFLWQAVDRLQTAIELESVTVEMHYNLACAYALLDQPKMALGQLRICLENDSNRRYHNTATTDPDLDNLRRTPEYNQLFPEESTINPRTIVHPRVSDH